MKKFLGKSVLVAGAGCEDKKVGIGRATSLELADLGAHVILIDKDQKSVECTYNMIKMKGGNASYFVCDVTDRSSVELVFSKVNNKFKLDGFFNAVGGGKLGGIKSLSYEDWDLALDLNLTSSFTMTRYVLESMLNNGGGSIVFMGSLHGIRYPGIPMIGYAVAKAGLLQLAKHVALEFADKGIRSNIVLAGAVDTPQIRSRVANKYGQENEDAVMQLRAGYIPQKRAASVSDIAKAVIFLLSDSSSHITAAELPIDGGASFVTVPSYITDADKRFLNET